MKSTSLALVLSWLLCGQPQGKVGPPSALTATALLTITSGFPSQPDAPNTLGSATYILLRDSFTATLGKGGIPLPSGTSPFSALNAACAKRVPECQKSVEAPNAANVTGARGCERKGYSARRLRDDLRAI